MRKDDPDRRRKDDPERMMGDDLGRINEDGPDLIGEENPGWMKKYDLDGPSRMFVDDFRRMRNN